MQLHNENKKKYSWTVLKDFTDSAVDITVRVQANDAYRPRYSIQVGRIKNEFLAPHLPIYIEVTHGKISGLSDYTEIVSRLMREARAYICEVAQKREDEIMTEKIAKEERLTVKAKPASGLKTLSKQDALKYAVRSDDD